MAVKTNVERIAHRWLESQFRDVVYSPRRTPAFTAAGGGRYEAKRVIGTQVVFYPGQVARLHPSDLILVFAGDTEAPAYIIPWERIHELERHGIFPRIVTDGLTVSVKLEAKVAHDLDLLRLAWGLPSLSEAVTHLVTLHAAEKVRALGITGGT